MWRPSPRPSSVRSYGVLSGIGQSACGTFAAANRPPALRAVIETTPPSQRWSDTVAKRATKPPAGPERTVRRARRRPFLVTVIRTVSELPKRAP